MKCFYCILRIAEDRNIGPVHRSLRDAITVYQGTALCEMCAVAAAERDKYGDPDARKRGKVKAV